MITKIRHYFIGNYLSRTDDVFEQARTIMLYRFMFVFSVLFILPVMADYTMGIYKALVKHSIDLASIIGMLFYLRWMKNFDKTVNFFFFFVTISYMLAFMILNPMDIDAIALLWAAFFFALSSLLQRGLARLLYCCFFGWIPIVYVLLNIKLKGALTVDWLTEHNIPGDPPIFLLFIPIVLLIIAIWSHASTIQKARETITAQKQVIEEKNKDITDSISYALRIQKAFLPEKEKIYSCLPQSFILNKPKDIVSGDFYFFQKNEELIFIAAADCTGHGVPGAFMSLVGSERLTDAVEQSKDITEILSLLNKGVKISLKQSDKDESTRDGMDIALCSVDAKKRIVKYAGANRPIWVIRNGQTTVEEIKATKKAIGGFTEDNQHFDTHVIQLQQGDTFYIFTDGFADTFGGQFSKKLTTKKFKEILLSIQDKSMRDQELHLNTFIENWKNGTEQVDDILVIGVRL